MTRCSKRFLCATPLIFAALIVSCSSDEPEDPAPAVPAGARETRLGYTIVWLHGTPYEMGYQHGKLLEDELRKGVEEINNNPMLKMMRDVAVNGGLDVIAEANSYPEILEECRGMVDAASHVGWGMTECIVLNTGDMLAEFVSDGTPDTEDLAPGCLQIVATGAASADGRMYHARLLDWFRVDYVVEHPTIFVRRPDNGIPHVFVSFPGNVAPYQGMNAEGLVVASNEVHARDNTVHDRTGESHVQMVSRILANARTIDDARAMVTSANHMTLEIITVSDAKSNRAEVYEMAPVAVGVRPLDDGLLYVTNHFMTSEVDGLDQDPQPEHSAIRWERLLELVDPEGPATRYGTLAPASLATVLRDRVNPRTGEESAPETFDNGESIATNGALYALVFDGASLTFWLSAGVLPVPQQPFTGFSLGELLSLPGYESVQVDPIP